MQKKEEIGGSALAKMIEERHALFDDVEKVVRDDDDLPRERGATGTDLKWWPVCGDEKLDKCLCGRVYAMTRKHPHAFLEPEDVVQRIRLKVEHARANYPTLQGVAWQKMAQTVITRELARYAKRLERECQTRHRFISRDAGNETDEKGDAVHWRDTLDFRQAMSVYDADCQRVDIEKAIVAMEGPSKQIILLYYKELMGLRTIAKLYKRPFSSFQNVEWRKAKEEFRKNFEISLVKVGR